MSDTDERLIESFNFRIPQSWREFANQVCKRERGDLSDVQRAIWERGMAAYKRDGLLFEPVNYEPEVESRRRKAG